MAHPHVNITDGANSNYILVVNPDGSLNMELQPSSIVRLSEAIINFNSTGDNTIVAGIANQVIRVYRYFFVVGAATNVVFKDGSTALTGAIDLAVNEAMVFTLDTAPWFTTSAGNSFVINQSGSAQVGGRLYYTQG